MLEQVPASPSLSAPQAGGERADAAKPAPGEVSSFRQLLLIACVNIYTDLHVNIGGIVFFLMLGYGILHPELKDQCQALVGLAGTYIFANAKRK